MDSYILKSPMSIYEVKEEKLSNYIERSKNVILNIINSNKIKLDSIKSSFIFTSPIKMIDTIVPEICVSKPRLLHILNIIWTILQISPPTQKALKQFLKIGEFGDFLST